MPNDYGESAANPTFNNHYIQFLVIYQHALQTQKIKAPGEVRTVHPLSLVGERK